MSSTVRLLNTTMGDPKWCFGGRLVCAPGGEADGVVVRYAAHARSSKCVSEQDEM